MSDSRLPTKPGDSLLRAAMRDASWYAHPGRARRYHVIPATEETGSLEAFKAETPSGCGITLTVTDYDTIAVGDVAAHMRCQRRGCREAWPS